LRIEGLVFGRDEEDKRIGEDGVGRERTSVDGRQVLHVPEAIVIQDGRSLFPTDSKSEPKG